MIKILVADDHQIVIDGIHSILEDYPEISVVATAHHGQEVLDILEHKEVDVAVLDVNMPILDGLETTKKILEKYNHINILILTMYKEEEKVLELFEVGALGYILKERGKEELVKAIKQVNKGEVYFGEEISKILINALKIKKKEKKKSTPNVKITKRELEVIKLIVDGATTQEIAQQLFIAVTTVESHRRNILAKLDLKNTALLVRYAIENRIV